MSIITSIILVAVIVIGVSFLAYYLQRGTKAMSEFKMDFDNNEQAQELAELAKELYNKDLRPIVAKKAPKAKKSELPIDQPTKKEKAVEATTADTTPQVTEKLVKIAQVVPEGIVEEPIKEETTTVNVEPVVEAVKPSKKKRKYYPKKK